MIHDTNEGKTKTLEEPVATHILIVDDSPLVRQRLGDLLQRHPHWEVCGEAVDGADAVEKAQALRPDLIVLDFMMPGMNGLQAAREIEGVEALLHNQAYFPQIH